MAAAAILDFFEAQFDVSGGRGRGRRVSTSVPNLVFEKWRYLKGRQKSLKDDIIQQRIDT